MSDKPMTREQVEDLLENVTLKFTQVLTDKLDEYGEKQKAEQKAARENTFEQGTGFPWEKRGHVKAAISYAHNSQKNSALWKGAGVITIVGLILKDFWENIFHG